MRALIGVLVVLYPGLVYGLLTWRSQRPGAMGLFLAASALAIGKWLAAAPGQRRRSLYAPVGLAALSAVAWCMDDHRYVLAWPVLVNLGLLLGFGSTLRSTPLVERFARMQVAQLSRHEVVYCRQVTRLWCAFFLLNGSVAAALAWLAPLSWWALYTGVVAYLLIGLVAAGEYVVRKLRFGRYGSGWHDRVLASWLPAPSCPVETLQSE